MVRAREAAYAHAAANMPTKGAAIMRTMHRKMVITLWPMAYKRLKAVRKDVSHSGSSRSKYCTTNAHTDAQVSKSEPALTVVE